MRYLRLLLLFAVATSPFVTIGQKVINITAPTSNTFFPDIEPFSFTEAVTFVVDVSGVPALAGSEPLYVWAFIQGCCSSPTNGSWDNSNEANVMTRVSPNVWSFTVPSVKALMSASYKQARDAAASQGRDQQETRFGFLVKAKDGSGSPERKTGDIELPFLGPVYQRAVFETFPINPAQDDVLKITYNQDLEPSDEMKNAADVYLFATAELVGGGTVTPVEYDAVISTPSLKLAKNGTSFSKNIIPKTFFNLQPNQRIQRINVVFVNGANAEINNDNNTVPVVNVQ